LPNRFATFVACAALALLAHAPARGADVLATTDVIVQDEAAPADAAQARPKFVATYGVSIHWPGGVYAWHYNPVGAPGAFANATTTVNAIKAGFAKWAAVCGVTENYLGTTAVAPDTRLSNGNLPDRFNVIGWGTLVGATAGLTYTWTSNAVLTDADIILDPAEITSTTAMASVATHEIGHVLGLSHSNVENALMSGPPLTTYNSGSTPAVDDIRGCRCMYGPNAAQTAGYFCSLPSSLSLGSVGIGATGPVQSLSLVNNGNGPVTVGSILVDDPQFRATGCTGTLAAGASCAVALRLAPTSLGALRATLRIETGEGMPYTVALTGTGVVAPTVPVLDVTPASLDFGAVDVGTTSAGVAVVVSNAGAGLLTLSAVGPLAGVNAADFNRTGTCAGGVSLGAGATCTMVFTFTPQAAGNRVASLDLATTAGARTIALAGVGIPPTVANATPVIEFYHAQLDHYFITVGPDEIAALDAGTQIKGWRRTGKSFRAFPVGTSGTSPVCRFYIPPAQGDSHYFGRGTTECDATAAAHPAFVLEEPRYLAMVLPTAGTCTGGTVPVYRVFSARADANHRYTTERAVRDQMVALGWLPEGDGPDLVVMCAPP